MKNCVLVYTNIYQNWFLTDFSVGRIARKLKSLIFADFKNQDAFLTIKN
jgi:hypothetical protein